MTREEVYKEIEGHYREKYETVVKTIGRSFNNFQDAEDVVQEAYTRACQYWDSYDAEVSIFDTWFEGVLENCLKDKKKDLKLQGGTIEYKVERDTRAINPSSLSKRELENIDELISKRPEHMQKILRLHLWKGYDISDIEKVVPEKWDNIRTIVMRFKKELREDEHMGRRH